MGKREQTPDTTSPFRDAFGLEPKEDLDPERLIPLVPGRRQKAFNPPDGPSVASIRCPHCRQMGTFRAATSGVKWGSPGAYINDQDRDTGIEGVIRICPNPECNGIVFTVMAIHSGRIDCYPPELLDFDGDGLPENLLKTLDEAVACHAAGAPPEV